MDSTRTHIRRRQKITEMQKRSASADQKPCSCDEKESTTRTKWVKISSITFDGPSGEGSVNVKLDEIHGAISQALKKQSVKQQTNIHTSVTTALKKVFTCC